MKRFDCIVIKFMVTIFHLSLVVANFAPSPAPTQDQIRSPISQPVSSDPRASSPQPCSPAPISEPSASAPGANSPEPSSPTQDGLFDITDYGAAADGSTEASTAFLKAWDAACAHPKNATFYVPEGTFLLGPVIMSGPCNNDKSLIIEIRGSLFALAKLEAFNSSDWITIKSLNGIRVTGGLESGGKLDGQGDFEAWKQESCGSKMRCDTLITSLKLINVSSATISRIALSNSKGFHLGIHESSLGKNSNERDVVGIHVRNCTIVHTQNGVRVKTWPGSYASKASNITFEGITMINVTNPILIDQTYCPSNSCNTTLPSLVKLANIHAENITGTYNTKFAVSLWCSTDVSCENLRLVNINLNSTMPENEQQQGRFNVNGVVNGLQVYNSSF
ncbi:hypothetical protein ACFE04_006511 [Oxalis oulophora]